MDEKLVLFKDDFYKECNTINFFLNLLKEIQTQIEFFDYICEKDFKILSLRAEKGLKYLEVLKKNIKNYNDEPSNLYLIEEQLIKYLYIYYSSFKNIYSDYLSSIKPNLKPININLENTRKNILTHSVSKLKQILESHNRNDLNIYMIDSLELIMTNTFKSLFNFYQLLLIYSKKKNNLFQTIKTSVEEKLKPEEIYVIISEMSERNYAKKYKINYEPLHFGNNVYKELYTDEKNDVKELAKSYLNYTYVFIKCIQIRKKLMKELKIYFEVIHKKEKEQLSKLKEICVKITQVTKSLSYSSQGIINTWNLIFSSWNSIYTNSINFFQFHEEICNPKLNKIINECKEEYKTFEKRWEKYSTKINELQEEYTKYSNLENNEENLSLKKSSEEKLKNFLSIDCTDFLDNNIPLLRENEIKRANEVRDLFDKIKSNANDRLEQYLENSEKEYDNAASMDLFEEIQSIFESQLEACGIKDQDAFLDKVKERIEKIDFNDDLAENARLSLAEYYEHNDFDEGFDLSQGETENPFSPVIKDNDVGMISFNEQKKLINSGIGKVKEEEISSIPSNEKNINMINLNNKENITPSFKMSKFRNENIINNSKNYEENDLSSDIKIINNLTDQFDEEIDKTFEKNNNIKEEFEINTDIENKNEQNNQQKLDISFDNKKNENYEKKLNEHEEDIKDKNLEENKKTSTKYLEQVNKIQVENNQNKKSVYYGILGILGLFCLKSLFSSNNFFSIDSFINIAILGIISFVIYKTQFE